MPMPMRRFQRAKVDREGSDRCAREPMLKLSNAAKAALTAFLAQTSLPARYREVLRCQEEQSDSSC